MESVKKRPRWIMVLVVVAVATATILLVPWDASAVTGSPTLTLVLTKGANTQNSVRVIDASGTYSDPDGVCFVGPGVVVTYTIRSGSATGPIVDSGTTTTTANGSYSFSSIPLPKGTTYFVTVSVTGSLAGGYGAGDICPNTSTTTSIAI